MRENVVGTIIILSFIPYTIICILICCMDRHTERKYAPLVKQVIRFVKQIQLQQKSRVSDQGMVKQPSTYTFTCHMITEISLQDIKFIYLCYDTFVQENSTEATDHSAPLI